MFNTRCFEPLNAGRSNKAAGILLFGAFCAALIFSTGAYRPKAGKTTDDNPQSRLHYNELGRTGLMVSSIGLGAGAVSDPSVIQYALDLGINFFDTAEGYIRGRSESAIGQVAAKHRDKMIICTKMGLNGQTKQEEIFERFDACLKRLQTTYVDILMIHGGNKDAVDNPEVHAAFEKLKKEGKIRLTGMSHHGPDIPGALSPVIAEKKLDVILCAYDPVQYPDLRKLLKKAQKKGMGIIAMKVFPSAKKAKLEEFESGLYPFHQAALRWVLRDKNVDSAIPSMNLLEQVDEYMLAMEVRKK